jgi:hypothetical protein
VALNVLRILAFVLLVAIIFSDGPVGPKLGEYAWLIQPLVIVGSVAIIVGPEVTGSGFFARGRLVTAGTPGCVSIGFGLFCWAIALGVYLFT